MSIDLSNFSDRPFESNFLLPAYQDMPGSPPSDALSCSSGMSAAFPLQQPAISFKPDDTLSLSDSPTLGAAMSPESPDSSSMLTISPDTPAHLVSQLLREQAMKRQRLARKAELARLSRKRKKTKLCDLEAQNRQLQNELEREAKLRRVTEAQIAALRAQLSAAPTPVAAVATAPAAVAVPVTVAATPAALEQEASELSGRLRTALGKVTSGGGQPASEELNRVLYDTVTSFNKRNIAATVALRNVKPQTEPSLSLRFLDWVLTQNDKFYEDQGLFATIFSKEVGMTPQQMTQLHQLRDEMKRQRNRAADVDHAFNLLRLELEGHLAQASQNMQKVISLLTPEQLAKFFAWIDTFGSVCIKINV